MMKVGHAAFYAYPKPEKPYRNKAYRQWVASQPCLYCGKTFAGQAHHVRWAGDCGAGMKPGDEYAVPLCHEHHDMIHNKPAEFGLRVERSDIWRCLFRQVNEYKIWPESA